LKIQNSGGRHLEKSQKLRYLRNGFANLYEIRSAGAKSAVKKFEFYKSKMADGRHFENR